MLQSMLSLSFSLSLSLVYFSKICNNGGSAKEGMRVSRKTILAAPVPVGVEWPVALLELFECASTLQGLFFSQQAGVAHGKGMKHITELTCSLMLSLCEEGR